MTARTVPGHPRGAHPLELYDAALARHAAGHPVTVTVTGAYAPEPSTVDVGAWCGAPSASDRGVVARCTGATLDVGCGPGRFTVALARSGVPALGVDVSPAAVALTRSRGGVALRRSVFGRLPGTGRWRHVLLMDGNVGIGADPVRLLARCRALLAPAGSVLVEVGPPGGRCGVATLRLSDRGRHSAAFRWAYLSVDALPAAATAAGLRVCTQWTEAGRWFAVLARS